MEMNISMATQLGVQLLGELVGMIGMYDTMSNYIDTSYTLYKN